MAWFADFTASYLERVHDLFANATTHADRELIRLSEAENGRERLDWLTDRWGSQPFRHRPGRRERPQARAGGVERPKVVDEAC